MHDARHLISHYCAPIRICELGERFRPKDNPPKKAIHGECSNHWGLVFCPDKKPSFFTRLLRAQIEARQRHADRVVEQYLAVHGNKFTDDADVKSSGCYLKQAGSDDRRHHHAARSICERGWARNPTPSSLPARPRSTYNPRGLNFRPKPRPRGVKSRTDRS